jgi:hypothetical protein
LHYKKSANDVWRTIDQRLRPVAPGVYEANNQPVPTKCDLNKKSTSITEHGFEFEFNKNLTMYFFDDATLYTRSEPGNYNTYTVGEEGLTVKNIWPGMDMEQQFTAGQIKTSYVIAAPLQIPVSAGYMVIEDHFTLPDGYSFVESELGHHIENDKYQGDYHLKNSKGETLITYEKPIYIDAKAWGMHGSYKLIRTGNNYTLQTLIPVSWLNKADNTYPIIIDPIVYGASKMGDFTQTGNPSASMGFTTMSLGSCPYQMNVFVPGKSRISNTYVDMEYSLTYDNTCGTPPLPAPFCTFSQVSMEVKSDECTTTTGPLTCNPASPPYTGTCTTDSNLVPGANAMHFAGLLPNTCLPAQCPDYNLHFTLLNRDSTCGDVCGYLCARGNMWRITVEADQDSTFNDVIVTSNNDTLFSSIPVGNQWYLDGSPIPGATGAYYVASHPGNYYTQTDSATCSGSSSPYVLNCSAQFFISSADSALGFPADSGYYFGVNASLGANLTYLWDFGDGDTSNLPYPSHTYAQPGHYNVCLSVSNAFCSDMHCDSSFYVFKTEGGLITHLVIQAPTGIEQIESAQGIKIYPNPATNELNIYSNGLPVEQVRLFSIDGRLIAEVKKGTSKIDISNFAKGAYIAEVKLQNSTKKIRWIKL